MTAELLPRVGVVVVVGALVAWLLFEELRWTSTAMMMQGDALNDDAPQPDTARVAADGVASAVAASDLTVDLKDLDGLQVCVVGPPSTGLRWAAILPLASIVLFPGLEWTPLLDAAHSDPRSHQRVLQVNGPIPRVVRTFFGRRSALRCGVSIIGANSSDSVEILRSVSSMPDYVLFDQDATDPLHEADRRRYFAKNVNGTIGSYALRRFDKPL